MYNWNGIRINVQGNALEFKAHIKQYFYADYNGNQKDCHINVYVNKTGSGIFTYPSGQPQQVRSYTLLVDREVKVDIYEYSQKIYYHYHKIASVLIDYNHNALHINLSSQVFNFPYYNVLLFFLNPLGLLLDNFGFKRAHSACAYIKDSSILFTGISGGGKSTSAFSMVVNGGNIISDDITYFKQENKNFYPHTVSSLAKLRKESVYNFFPQLLHYSYMKNSEDELYFYINDLNANLKKNPKIRAIVILNKTMQPVSSLRPIAPSKVVPHIFPSSIRPNSRNTENNFLFLTELLDQVPCYEADFGTDMANF
ncbi:MAG: hypothetical protein PHN32_08770, partial [Actinomycetota bacterium]|nr:hypothetical protein [Actinomycetota bacterium]